MLINNHTTAISQLSSNDGHFSAENEKSKHFANIMATAAHQEATDWASTKPGELFTLDTSHGNSDINLDQYLTPKPHSGPVDLKDIPLLLPTAHNIDTLSKYSEAKFKDLLEQYNISVPPATIEFDGEGKLVIPSDYPHAKALRAALNENPGTENALRTTAALASHFAGIMEGQAFRDEMSTARSQADRDRIVQKYSYLFDDSRPQAQVVLAFLEDGSMLVGEKNS